ncbi:josephin-like protein [Drosophila busckii]|uniref:josephin-like protein n=1 Tax=Drosophila busckii TaxID=30019 RepID=UPI00083E9A78|nr:josephin-like protein [Drosophila busckii]
MSNGTCPKTEIYVENRKKERKKNNLLNVDSNMLPSKIYHEQQVSQLCALHALNNLYQRRNLFTKQKLDAYCYELTPRGWLNPHRSWLGWGNYDVNVIMYAVQQQQCQAIWFDKRRDPDCLNFPRIFGYILNMATPPGWRNYVTLPIWGGRHWLALRCIGDDYYNLDSKLSAPECIGNESNFVEFLRAHLSSESSGDQELLIIVQQFEEEEEQLPQSWLKPEYRLST